MIEQLNMDHSQRVVINTKEMEWESSPSGGVLRKKLEREAAESGRVTSVVRYKPNSQFRPHSHPAGEEIYVLSGVFEDDNGSYPAGTYVRNPPGSNHAPRVEKGCDIFVKLNMFGSQDLEVIQIPTFEQAWQPGTVGGLSVMQLHSYNTEHTALVRWDPGTQFNQHIHPGGEEILVLSGVLEDEDGQYPEGTWLRSPPYSRHQPFSTIGCTIFVKTGHLG